MKHRDQSSFPGILVSWASRSLDAVINRFRKTPASRLLILGLLALPATLAGAQTIFNCSSGFSPTLTAPCGVGIGGTNGPGTFEIGGSPNGSSPGFSGTQMLLAPSNGDHTAINLDYYASSVNVQAFVATYTFIPNGWNISLTLSNNTNTNGARPGSSFTSGAGCEGSFYQAFPSPPPPPYPNKTFALMLDQHSPLTDANAGNEGGGGGETPFTYSNTQLYQQGMDPCNPRDGTEKYFYATKKISTYPVPLNSPLATANTTTGHTYSVTVTYTGAALTEQLYDITAGGSCPGASCFTYTWYHVSVPSIVGATTAWVGLAESTNAPSGFPLYVKTFGYTVLSAAVTPTFSPSVGTYGSTQSVTISDSTSGSIICYNTTGAPATNGIGACENGTLYTGAISVPQGQTIYAVAGSDTTSYGDSAVASSAYNITGSASQPTYSASSGTYQGNQTIILTAAHGGVICYNTTGSPATDGSTGCNTGTLYSSPITVSSNETLYSVAGGTGFSDSAVSSATYSISPYWGGFADSPVPPATPTFSPLPGTYTGTQSVTLASSTANSYICYSLSATPLVVLPYADSMGGCTQGTLYTGPLSISSSETLSAVAGVPQTAYAWGGSAPSSPTAGTYTIGGAPAGPGMPTGVKANTVPQ